VTACADWRPSATSEQLRARAAALARVRTFFAARGVLEVETPLLLHAAVTDVHLHSLSVQLGVGRRMFLQTSPEYAMKRLLAAGSGDIYQVCRVVRGGESGTLHNPEFTLIEWYRLGFALPRLLEEVETLVRELLGARLDAPTRRISYQQAFRAELGVDPLGASLAELAEAARGLAPQGGQLSRDEYLELLMALRVGPRLGAGGLTFVYGYPASQAALARLDPAAPGTAARFELYAAGVELANGFHELADPLEQRRRFDADNAERRRRGLPLIEPDVRLLAALEAGLPDCAGVALGLDRLLLLASGARHLDEVLAFPSARA